MFDNSLRGPGRGECNSRDGMSRTKRIPAFGAALLSCALLIGCRAGEQERSLPAAVQHGGNAAEEPQAPYYPGLIEDYLTLLAEDPHSLAALIALGNAYYDSGQWKDAVKYYQRALQFDPRNADVLTDLGTAYRNLGMPERALAEYRQALKHQPDHLNARYNLGIVYAYDKKNYAAAVRVWEDLLRIAPNYPQRDRVQSCIMTFTKVLETSAP